MNMKRMPFVAGVAHYPFFGGSKLNGLVDAIGVERFPVDREVGGMILFGKGDDTLTVDVGAGQIDQLFDKRHDRGRERDRGNWVARRDDRCQLKLRLSLAHLAPGE